MWLALLLALLALILVYRWYRQSHMLEDLTNKYVLITGCDSGFGNLLAKKLDTRGMKVLASCLTEAGAENLKKETSSRLQTRILDLANPKSVSSAAQWVSSIVGDEGLWGLVNNAGFTIALAPNEWQTREDFSKVLDINLLGTMDLTVRLLHLIRKARGRIVIVTSAAGRLAIVGGGYCPSKFGLEAFSDSLRREMRGFGVKVSVIEPGGFKTMSGTAVDLHIGNVTGLWEKLPAHVKESYGEEYLQHCINSLKALTGSTSPKSYQVSDCMEHALTAVHPWTRYSPGWDCKLYYLPVSYLPTAISDYVLWRSAPKPAHMESADGKK